MDALGSRVLHGAMPERFLVLAAMRDEGAFIVEWVSWYRMLGFEVLVAVNDCTDHSPALLGRLAAEGWCEVVEHRPRPGQHPKASAHRALRAHPALARADWAFLCDADEFLVLHAGGGRVGGFLDAMGRDVLGYAVHWQCFGDGGHDQYQDGLVHERLLQVGAARRGPNTFFKTLFREPARWRRLSDHAPHGYDGAAGDEGSGVLDTERRPIARFASHPPPIRFSALREITHLNAQVNHYAIRSAEGFELKRGTPSASAGKDRYTDAFLAAMNRNERPDPSALAYRAAFAPVHAAALALPGVRRLHHLCCADYVARLCARAGRAPEADARWQHHRREAAAG